MPSYAGPKEPFEVRDALSIMRGGRGSHFDADLLDLFFESIDEVERPLDTEDIASPRLVSATADPTGH
jgi:HD-GYP domain-containing protein (c-di-GMP phosphodiesterase class II)